ncbi:MAG TPA: type VI secretion system tip protein VgrG [Chitinophagaceae bacterium]|jgi:Rhs element Vgr protein|nr:type VI secretion system tip protein VgrG [Chitinophagaceae bacterium]
MTEERIIPEVKSVAEFRISIGGEEIPRTIEVVAVHVSKVINKISMARFIIRDGDASKSDFVLSNGELFIPGKEVEITAGSPDQQESIFKGVVIKQSISIRGNKSSQLIIDCRHKAVKSTIVRRSNCYHDKTDDAAISEALQASGLSTEDFDLEATNVSHSEMVQYNCTDWDFAVSRAEMNGKIILTNDEKITMKAPGVTASGTLSLLFGATVIELDAEMDSRTQYKAVKASSWDMATQELAEANAEEPDAPEWGNLDGSTLSDAMAQEEYLLQHGGALIAEEIQSWADAQLLKSRLARIRGRVKFEGISAIHAGDVLELHGLGDRFNGNAFVTGVRHDYTTTEGWKTQAQFGNTPDWFIEQPDVVAPKAGGLLPGAIGLHTGIVTDNEDPEGEFRVRVKIPFINPDDDGVWARVALTDAGNERGMYFRPEVDDEVLLGFLYDDPRQPVILGMLHSSALPSPLTPSNDNHQKGYTSREKLVLLFDDEKKEVKIETPGGNKVTISDDKKGIVMEDQNGNSITMNDKGIVIDSASAIEIKAAKDLKLTGLTASMSGDSSMEIKSSGSGTVESSANLTIKGAMVNIN